MVICDACQQENPDGSRFCNSCGGPLPGLSAGVQEERRIVTVLFADMAGFTARSERLDPEDVRTILNRYYARLRAEIEVFGGTVEKFIGDAVVAVFGAPVAHGDDPERAVRSAFAIRGALAEMNAADPELHLEVRIAVNTGEVIVSVSNLELRDGMFAGDVVNTASRLQAAAPTNGVLVGEETFRATRNLIDYRQVEPIVAKGKREPVRAWLATGSKAAPGERAISNVPMLGRIHEIATLHRVFEGVFAERRPHLVTILGEAGIGKTRLAAEFTAQLEHQGVLILRGRSLPYGASTMYGPFSQQVKQFANIFASDDVSSAQEKLRSAIDGIAPGSGADIGSSLELLLGLGTEGEVADRQILFLAARRFAEMLAHDRPTMLVFEDLHWAESGTLDLVEVLASRVREVPMMWLGLARPDLLVTRSSWGGGLPACTTLSLEALGREDSAELTARLLHRHAVGEQEARVTNTAEGNPLFIEELAAAAIERQGASRQNLPTTIRELVSARLDALPSEERSVLLDASVVGKVFWRGALERMRDDGVDVLSDALDSLEARDLIRRERRSWIEREEQFTFKHALICEVSYATLPRARRKQLHGMVAAFLEEVTRGAAATATGLARHWREAGENDRALEYLLLAADKAGRGWAKEEAARLYGEALELCASDTPRRREIARKQALAMVALQHVFDMHHQPRESGVESSPALKAALQSGGEVLRSDVADDLGNTQDLM